MGIESEINSIRAFIKTKKGDANISILAFETCYLEEIINDEHFWDGLSNMHEEFGDVRSIHPLVFDAIAYNNFSTNKKLEQPVKAKGRVFLYAVPLNQLDLLRTKLEESFVPGGLQMKIHLGLPRSTTFIRKDGTILTVSEGNSVGNTIVQRMAKRGQTLPLFLDPLASFQGNEFIPLERLTPELPVDWPESFILN